MATGEDGPNSDVDLFVVLEEHAPGAPLRLTRKFRGLLGRPVHVVTAEQARLQPSLFADVLSEGRVLIDRDRLWESLLADKDETVRAAAASEDATSQAAKAAIAAVRARVLEAGR
jgi:hypothetical protein